MGPFREKERLLSQQAVGQIHFFQCWGKHPSALKETAVEGLGQWARARSRRLWRVGLSGGVICGCGWDQLTGDLGAITAWQGGQPQLQSKTHVTHGSALTLL